MAQDVPPRVRPPVRIRLYRNDPELDDEPLPSPETYEVALRLDPLNPKRYLLPDDGEHPEWNDFFGGWSSWVKREQSLAELPAALPQPWVAERADVAKGIVDKHRFESATLGNTRAVYVYTSPGYDATSESTWLLILFDAWSYRAIIPMPTILDNLVADGDIPPLAAVLVDHPSFDERMRELSFEEPGPAFETAVADEVMPWIGERYRVASDARRVIIGGASNGADAAARIAVAHPELFGNVLSQSGTYGRSPSGDTEPEWLARWIANRRGYRSGSTWRPGRWRATPAGVESAFSSRTGIFGRSSALATTTSTWSSSVADTRCCAGKEPSATP